MVEHAQPIADRFTGTRRRRVAATLEAALSWAMRHAVLFPMVALFVIGVVGNLPTQLFQDMWLAILGGREVFEHGLPTHDTLAIWTHGREWVDQQWLAQLVFYGLYAVGGAKLALLGHALAVAAAFTLAIVLARRRGASTRSICWVAVPAYFLLTWTAWVARAQSLALLLFVVLLALLLSDARSPSRRVYWTLPLVALWSNIHGTAVVAAALVALRGITLGLEQRRAGHGWWSARATLLVVAPFLCLFASPYALRLPHYYSSILFNNGFRKLVVEWAPTAPSFQTAPFYLLAFACVWLIGRERNRLTTYEQVALLLTLVLGLQALRSVIWFTLTALILLPTLLDGALKENTAAMRFPLLNRAFVVFSVLGVAATLAIVAAKPASWFESGYPTGILTAYDAAHTRDPNVRVFADEMYGDWLLLRRPEMRGRLAFDIRFELTTKQQLQQLLDVKRRVEGWRRALAPYGLFVLKKGPDTKLANSLKRLPGMRVVFRGHDAIVISRRQP
jgi:hypothetical protein